MSMKRFAATALVALTVLTGTAVAAEAAPKAKAKSVKVVKAKPVAKKVAVKAKPVAKKSVARVAATPPDLSSQGLVYVETRTWTDASPEKGTRSWVIYRGPEVWLNNAEAGTITTWVYRRA